MRVKIQFIKPEKENEILRREHIIISDSETGEMIKGIQNFVLTCDVEKPPKIVMTVVPESLEMIGSEFIKDLEFNSKNNEETDIV